MNSDFKKNGIAYMFYNVLKQVMIYTDKFLLTSLIKKEPILSGCFYHPLIQAKSFIKHTVCTMLF